MRFLQCTKAQVTTHHARTEARAPRQKQVHLSDDSQLELVARFQAGATQRELAGVYGVHRTTVAAILKRYGVDHLRGLTGEQIDDAVHRYITGQSLAITGQVLRVDPGTVRARLIERGVRMRTTGGKRD